MKFEQIEQVLEVVKTGTFSQAARNLYMSQPNLSLSIKQLEDELGCPLFIRTSEGVIPTEEGKYLIEHMRAVQSKYHMIKNYGKSKEPRRLSLRIAMTNFNRTMPYFIKIARKYMGSPIDFAYINCLNLDDVIEKVVTCQVDFALVGMMEPNIKNTISMFQSYHIEYHPLSKSKVSAVVGPENPFYERTKPLTLEDLVSQTLITFGNETTDPFGAIYVDLSSFGKITVNNYHLFYEMVRSTPAMGLISCRKEAFYRTCETWKELRLIEIEDYPVSSESGWIKLRRMPLSDIASELIAELNDVF